MFKIRLIFVFKGISLVAQTVKNLPATWETQVPSLGREDLLEKRMLSITNAQNLLKLMSVESEKLSNHLILCHPLLLLSSIFPSSRVFPSEFVLPIRWPMF